MPICPRGTLVNLTPKYPTLVSTTPPWFHRDHPGEWPPQKRESGDSTKIVITIESTNLIRGDNRGHQKAERPRPLAACSTGVGIRNVPATHDFKHDY